MLKKIGLPVLFLLLLGAVVYAIVRPDVPAELPTAEDVTQQVQEVIEESKDGGADFGLLLKAAEITQGEDGRKLWHLKAEQATLQQQDGLIVAEKPRLTYYIPPDGKELIVVADTADVNQTDSILRFVHNVHAASDGNTLIGPLLVYNGTARSMFFPEGGAFLGQGIVGSADQFVWRMDQHEIEGTGNVHVVFESPETLAPANAGQ